MIATDLSKQQALDADPKEIQQINCTGNLKEQSTVFFIIEEVKETFFKRNCKSILTLFLL